MVPLEILPVGMERMTGIKSKANINRFNKGKQLSFLGMGNNINEQGFSMDDYMNFTGGAQQMMSEAGQIRVQIGGDNQNGVPLNFGNRANGIMQTYAGGLNFNNEFNKKTELNGSYFYNFLDHDKFQTVFRENFLQNGRFTYHEKHSRIIPISITALNHDLDHKIDSANSIRFSTNVTYNETYRSKTISQNNTPEQTVLNENTSQSISQGSTQILIQIFYSDISLPKKEGPFPRIFNFRFITKRSGWLAGCHLQI